MPVQMPFMRDPTLSPSLHFAQLPAQFLFIRLGLLFVSASISTFCWNPTSIPIYGGRWILLCLWFHLSSKSQFNPIHICGCRWVLLSLHLHFLIKLQSNSIAIYWGPYSVSTSPFCLTKSSQFLYMGSPVCNSEDNPSVSAFCLQKTDFTMSPTALVCISTAHVDQLC